ACSSQEPRIGDDVAPGKELHGPPEELSVAGSSRRVAENLGSKSVGVGDPGVAIDGRIVERLQGGLDVAPQVEVELLASGCVQPLCEPRVEVLHDVAAGGNVARLVFVMDAIELLHDRRQRAVGAHLDVEMVDELLEYQD